MWQILKADIQYHKVIIGIVYAIALFLFIGDLVFGMIGQDMMMGITTMSFFAAMWIIGATDDKEKRDRYQATLPNPIGQRSIVRLLFCILFQAGILIIWITLLLLKYTGDADRLVWDIFSINALNIIIILLFVIFSDLGNLGTKVYRYIFLGVVLFVIFCLIWLSVKGSIQYPLSFGPEIRKSPLETLVYNILCVGLLYFDHTIFVKRKSYLN